MSQPEPPAEQPEPSPVEAVRSVRMVPLGRTVSGAQVFVADKLAEGELVVGIVVRGAS